MKVGPNMGPPPGPGIQSADPAGIADPIEKILEIDRQKIQSATARKDVVVHEKNEFSNLGGMLDELGQVANSISSPSQFAKMKLDSSHPDILDGVVEAGALPGSYEFEIKGLATQDKHLDVGFPDIDDTPVGFGFMHIESDEGKSLDITIDPGSTLQDVATKINSANGNVKAQIVNTGFDEDPFRLLVTATESGAKAKISIDEDTTFLNFKNITQGKGLDASFEGVDVTSKANKLNELIDGVNLTARKADPGTKIQVNVDHDVDATFEGIVSLAESYNKIASFSQKKAMGDTDTGGGASVRQISRRLQSQMASLDVGGKYKSLAEIGITTNPKLGTLDVDESKLKAALKTDFANVASVFANSEHGKGLASRISDTVRQLKDPVHGVVPGRIKSMNRIIADQNRNIERQEGRMEERRAALTRTFSRLQSNLSAMESQNQMMMARMGQSQGAQ